ncbi:MAG: FG-GAP repeat domain-containing protein, partial [Pseudomonadales bacterium]
DGKPHRQWRLPGRAMTTQVPQMLGLVAGDVDGDGRVEVLAVQENRDGSSRLVAINLDGVARWHYDFPDFGGRAPIWNECGTTIWSVGHFFDNRRIGVLVSNRRSIMHSDETVIIDPKTDKLVWHRDVLEVRQPWTDAQWSHTRGYGGGPVALADFDDDGLDEIVLCYPAEYSVVKGVTGEQLIVESTGPLKGTDGFWVFSGQPLVADLDGDGQPETLWTSPSMIIAFAHRNGRAEILWRTEPNDGTNALPAIGDVDGDGHFEIGVPGCQDGFRCLDGATGTVQWTIPSRGDRTSNCVAVDIDSDGIEEFIYADGSKLLATGREGRIKWEFDLPVPIEYIVVADVDDDENAEILVSGSNGVVYCVE